MVKNMPYRVGILCTHPIQYYAPWYRALAQEVDLEVFFCHRQTGEGQAEAGFGVPFEWDTPVLEGYSYRFLTNRARRPNVFTFWGCDTPEIRDVIHRECFDAFIVHGWYVKSYWQAILACWQTGTPILVRGDSQLTTPRSAVKRLFKLFVYRAFIPRFDGYLVVGERNRQYYLYYGADESKMFFTPHAVDNEFFASTAADLRPERERLRTEWGIPPDATVFLFAGKFIPVKRPLDFVRAIEQAAQSNQDLWGLMVGDGPFRAEIETLIKQKGLPIALSGFLNQTEMPKAYAASDVLVLPSESETWGLVVNEAMASGLPAVISDTVGCALDLVKPGQTGEIFPSGLVVELTRILVNFAREPVRIQRMGINACSYIERYSVSNVAEGTLAAVRFIAASHNRSRR